MTTTIRPTSGHGEQRMLSWLIAVVPGVVFLAGAAMVALSMHGSRGLLLIGMVTAIASALLLTVLRSRLDPSIPWHRSDTAATFLWRRGARPQAFVSGILYAAGVAIVVVALILAIV